MQKVVVGHGTPVRLVDEIKAPVLGTTAIPTIGSLRGAPPVEPKKPAEPHEKVPPSNATSQ